MEAWPTCGERVTILAERAIHLGSADPAQLKHKAAHAGEDEAGILECGDCSIVSWHKNIKDRLLQTGPS